jgi:hypothetical protein
MKARWRQQSDLHTLLPAVEMKALRAVGGIEPGR